MTPDVGPRAGGQTVSISGRFLCKDIDDIISVKLANVPVSQIISANFTEIVVISGSSDIGSQGFIEIHTKQYAYHDGWYTYPTPGNITYTRPVRCTSLGGCHVHVNGDNLYNVMDANITDITYISVCDKHASILFADQDEVIIVAPPNDAGQICTISINSYLYGTTNSTFDFTYITPGHIVSFYPTFGPQKGGELMYIRGKNLCSRINATCDAKFVSIAGYSASIQSSSEELIVVEIPEAEVGCHCTQTLMYRSKV